MSAVPGLLSTHAVRTLTLLGAVALLALVCQPAAAFGATPGRIFTPPIGGLLGDIAHAVLGGVDWTVNVAGDFIMNLLGGLVKVLIPRSWIGEGLSIIAWLVAVPDYSAQITTPGGGRAYGFGGVNEIRGLFTWLGLVIAPLSLLYATSRAWSGQGDHVAAPLVRVFTAAIGVLSYTWLWAQAVALTNQITKAILGVGAVRTGIQKMFELLIAGGALAGLPFIGVLLMGVGGVGLLSLIFVKVLVVLVGALAYATGPLMPGISATERGNAIARGWFSVTAALFALAILWTSVFALSAVLISDASSAGAILGGDSDLGELLGGVVIAMAAIAGFFLNIKLTKALAGMVGGQLAGMLALLGSSGGGGARGLLGGGAGGRSGAGAGGAGLGGAAASLRGFAAKVGGAASGAAGALMPAGRPGQLLAGAGALAQGGLIGAGATLASRGLASAAGSRLGQAAGATRAGAVATRMARGARAGWNTNAKTATASDPTATAASTPNAPQPPGRTAGAAVGRASFKAAPGSSSTPLAGARRDRPSGGTAGPPTAPAAPTSPLSEASLNESARNAFGRPPAKPTRTFRQRLTRGRKP